MANDELEFANDANGSVDHSAQSANWQFLIVIAALMLAAIVWAAWANIQQVTNGEGRVIPSSQVQIVESLEPGILAEIMVAEGDRVEQGQELVRIDDTGASSRLGELRRREAALSAELHRLVSHSSRESAFTIPADVQPENRAFYDDQRAIFVANEQRIKEQKTIRRQQLLQKKQSLEEAAATANNNARMLELANRELKLMQRLYNRKAVPEIDYLRSQKASTKLQGDLAIWAATRVRLQAEIDEAAILVDADENTFLTEISARMSTINAELAVVRETLRAATDTVRRTVLRSPVTGIVNKLNVNSINEVIKAGTSVVEIVPIGETLLVEAQIRPEDIAFIRPGLPATIRITAYDYTRYGTLSGTVDRIGADTLTDSEGRTFYRVVVNRNQEQVSPTEENLKIIPGMVATVDIETGSRTVLEYLLKPILVMKDRALRDPR
ncbi:MAG: HlyD family type I secretion periplasmic adaptor subunit [Pseudomonadota bacterium]